MEKQTNGNVYLILEELDEGRLFWRVVKPMEVGAIIDAAGSLDAMARKQVLTPPVEVAQEIIKADDDTT